MPKSLEFRRVLSPSRLRRGRARGPPFTRRRISEVPRKFAPDTERRPGLLTGMLTAIGNGLGGEAGLGLNATIARVGEERSTIADIMGAEFAQVALELRNGRTRADALRGAQPPERLRRTEGACRPRHPERPARRQYGEDASHARRPAAYEAPPARRGGGPQAAHQDPRDEGPLDSAGVVRRRPGSRRHQHCPTLWNHHEALSDATTPRCAPRNRRGSTPRRQTYSRH